MQFFEQIVYGRVIIHSEVVTRPDVEADRVVSEIDAECWIEAKKNFGYPLSAVQDWLLGEFYRKRKSVTQ